MSFLSSSSSDSDSDSASSSSSSLSLHINESFASSYDQSKRSAELSQKSKKSKKAAQLSEIAAILKKIEKTEEIKRNENGEIELQFDEEQEQSEEEESASEDSEGELLTEAVNRRIAATLSAIRKKDPKLYDSQAKFFPEEEEQEQNNNRKQHNKKLSVKDVLLNDAVTGDASDDDGEVRMTHVEEQRKLKEDFLKSAANSKRNKHKEEDEEEDEDEELFKVRIKGAEAPSGKSELRSASIVEPRVPASDNEFLDSFLSEEWWRAKDLSRLPSYEQLKGEPMPVLSDAEDEQVDREEKFEAAYNFRFEQENSAVIPSYPRQIADSLRNPDQRRKQAREQAKKLKEEEKQRKQEEIKKAKNEKKKEIEKKLHELERIAGIKLSQEKLNHIKFSGNWDESDHEKLMALLFDEEFEQAEEEDEEKLREIINEGEELEMAPGAFAREEEKRKKKFLAKNPQIAEAASSIHSSLTEYSQLDCEDLIGDMKIKFKYRKVQPETFGLSIEDILNLPDKELNQKASFKKIVPYQDMYQSSSGAGRGRQQHYQHQQQQERHVPEWKRKIEENSQNKKRKRMNQEENQQTNETPHNQTPTELKSEREHSAKVSAARVRKENDLAAASSQPLSASQKRRLREKKRKLAIDSETTKADEREWQPAAEAAEKKRK